MTLPWSRAALEQGSFTGFVPFADLPDAHVPESPGVYAVLRPGTDAPRFLESSGAGTYRQKDPTVALEVLAKHWVDGAEVLYIGMVTPGAHGTRSLRTRLDEYRRQGPARRPGTGAVASSGSWRTATPCSSRGTRCTSRRTS